MRLWTYLITTGVIAGGLLAFNVVSHRKIVGMVARATAQTAQNPYAFSRQTAMPEPAAQVVAQAPVQPWTQAPVVPEAVTPAPQVEASPQAPPPQPPAT